MKAIFGFLAVWCGVVSAISAPTHLRTEFLERGLGIGTPNPRFSWIPACDNCPRGYVPDSYRIVVQEMEPWGSQVMWDSGVVQSNDTVVEYAGNAKLEAEHSYIWSVSVGSGGEMSPNGTTSFDVAPSSWGGAKWVAGNQHRVEFSIPAGDIVRARAYVAAPGGFTAWVNGVEYSSAVLGGDDLGYMVWLQYAKRVNFYTLDVTSLVQSGDNAVGLLLGCGFWCHDAHQPTTLLFRLTVDLSNGDHVEVVSSDNVAPPTNTCVDLEEHSTGGVGCPNNGVIDSVTFASFGTPEGSCSSTPKENVSCNAPNAPEIIKNACVGQQSCLFAPACDQGNCNILQTGGNTVPDPCHMVRKRLLVQITCKSSEPTQKSTWETTQKSTSEPTQKSTWEPTQKSTSSTPKWTVNTDPPLLNDDPWGGAKIDWRKFESGWNKPNFQPSKGNWQPASSGLTPLGSLHPMPIPSARLRERIAVQNVTKLADGHYRYAFPLNLVGVCTVNVPASMNKPGVNITLKHGEIYDNVTGAVSFPFNESQQIDVHILDGTTSTLTPRFTWHGFQFVEVFVTGADFDAPIDFLEAQYTFTGVAVTANVSFQGSDNATLLSKIATMTQKTQQNNVAAYIPTDCPTREKHGWAGDSLDTIEEALYNLEMITVYEHFLSMYLDDQDPSSGDVPGALPSTGYGGKGGGGGEVDISWTADFPMTAYLVWQRYGLTRGVVDSFDGLERYMAGLLASAAKAGLPFPEDWTWGDWCAIEAREIATPNTGPGLATFNFIRALDAMAEMSAEVIRNETKAAFYAGLAAKYRPLYASVYQNASGLFGKTALEVQTMTSAPLLLGGVIPKNQTQQVLDKFRSSIASFDNHLTYGSGGASMIYQVLSANGMHDVALSMATKTSYPSYGWWISEGATTCWESWLPYASPMHPPAPTHGHIFLCGGIGQWLYQTVWGVSISKGGLVVDIAPTPSFQAGVTSATGSYDTLRGTVSLSWTITNPTSATINASIPLASLGRIQVPVPPHTSTLYESGKIVWQEGSYSPGQPGIKDAQALADAVLFTVGSGTYVFSTHP